MAFTQVTDLLQRTAGYHGRARRAFARWGRRGGASAHLAQFLAGEEEDMMRELRALDEAHRLTLGEAWLQFEPDEALDVELAALETEPPTGFESIGSRALDLDERLCGYLGRAAAMAPTPGVREIFEGLERRERDHRKRLAGFLSETLM